MLRIHREGKIILRNSFLLLLLLNLFTMLMVGMNKLYVILPMGVLSVLLYIWILYFFRDPARHIHAQEEMILSPADGKVVAIKQVYEDEYFQKDRIQISIFMSPLNVHVNRSPVSGVLQYYRYHPGKYLVAFHPKSSTKNERTTAIVKRKDGVEILFRQIAGFMARRIKFYPQVGDLLQQGQEVGFIKFGSRLDLFLPLDTIIQVSIGDHVQGGLSTIATLKSRIA
jgi:phosphatidylserine decarboxylase